MINYSETTVVKHKQSHDSMDRTTNTESQHN